MIEQLLSALVDIRILFALAVFSLWMNRRSRRVLLPPGPKQKPLLGNTLDIPQYLPWIEFHTWAEQYKSDLIFLQLPFQPVIVVDSVKAAVDLMDKRARIYSDKPIAVMDELTGWEWDLAVQRYGPAWRTTRRYFHQHFHQGAVHQYREAEKREIRAFLLRALQSEERLNVRSVHQIFSALIMDIVYGIKVDNMDNEYVALTEHVVKSFGIIKTPGAFWIDSFPLMKYIPAWFPGATARKFGEAYKPLVRLMRDKPFYATKDAMSSTTGPLNMVQKLLRRIENFPDPLYTKHETYAKDAAGIAYAAGVETSLNTMAWFLVAMAMHPSVQTKARQELDTVLGTSRLPELEDLDSMPFLQAIYMETLRWIPVLPMGVPHRVMEEDEYNGYRIPKGSTIIPNVWAMLHNPDDYPHPECFDPERFLKDGNINAEIRDPATVIFGFGRRICPGRYFAKETLLLTLASVLSVFDIVPVSSPDGGHIALDEIDPGVGILVHPRNIGYCALKPRSAEAKKLIRECEDNDS